MDIKFIVAIDKEGGIGKNGKLPWPMLSHDMNKFKKITIGNTNNAVIMGRKTYESIPLNLRPLRDRVNIILSRHNTTSYRDFDDNCIFASNRDEVFDILRKKKFDEVFVIGGSEIYKLFYDYCTSIILTKIDRVFDCDTYMKLNFTDFNTHAEIGPVILEKGLQYRYFVYDMKKIKKPHSQKIF